MPQGLRLPCWAQDRHRLPSRLAISCGTSRNEVSKRFMRIHALRCRLKAVQASFALEGEFKASSWTSLSPDLAQLTPKISSF